MRRGVVAVVIALASGCSLTIDWPSYSNGGPLLPDVAAEAAADVFTPFDAEASVPDAGPVIVEVTQRNGGTLYTTPCDLGQTLTAGACVGERTLLPYNNGNTHGGVYVGAVSDDDGNVDTILLLAADSDADTAGVQLHRAAQACADLVFGGFDDWYLPSSGELVEMQKRKDAVGNFDPERFYKSSTETHSQSEPYNAAVLRFKDGYLYGDGDQKPENGLVRCARFAL